MRCNRAPLTIAVLASLLDRAPGSTWQCGGDEGVSAFCLGRSGTRFSQIGPVVARDEDSARRIMLSVVTTDSRGW